MLRAFPYYTELDAIWGGIPSFDSDLISSHPNINHAGSFLDTVQKPQDVSPSQIAGASAERTLDVDETQSQEDGSEDVDGEGGHRDQDRFAVQLPVDEPEDGAAFNFDHDDRFNMDVDPPLGVLGGLGPSESNVRIYNFISSRKLTADHRRGCFSNGHLSIQ